MVPLNGLEPLLPCGNRILSPRLQSTTLETIALKDNTFPCLHLVCMKIGKLLKSHDFRCKINYE